MLVLADAVDVTPIKAQRIRRREDVNVSGSATKQNKTNPARDAKTFSRFFCGCERKQGRGEQEEVRWGGQGSGGDDTSKTDRKTGRRRWEMERKGGEKRARKSSTA